MLFRSGKLRSHLPQLWFALAFHILAPGVAILVARGDPPLQRCRPWAIRAPSQRHWTVARPLTVGGGSGARRHTSTAGVDARCRRRRRGTRGCGQRSESSLAGMALARGRDGSVLYQLMTWTRGGSRARRCSCGSFADVDKWGSHQAHIIPTPNLSLAVKPDCRTRAISATRWRRTRAISTNDVAAHRLAWKNVA